MTRNTRDALADLGLTSQHFENGEKVKHKFRKHVTGEIRLRDRDYQVKWSDGNDWEPLRSGDVGGPA